MISIVSNTILATVVFLFFIFPGLIFLRVLWGSTKGSLQPNNLYSYLIWGALVSAILYPAFTILVNDVIHLSFFRDIHFRELWDSLFKTTTVTTTTITPKANTTTTVTNGSSFLSENINEVFVYFIAANLHALLLSIIFSRLILWLRLDLRIPALKIRNEWFYILTDRRKGKKSRNRFYVEVHFLCEVGKSIIKYKGVMDSYTLTYGSLEYIYLKSVSKTLALNRTLPDFLLPIEGAKKAINSIKTEAILNADTPVSGEKKINSEFYSILGDIMVFKVSEIKNINITYVPLPSKSKSKKLVKDS